MLASGIPYLMGTERFKGSHSMSGYHSFELCYLAQVYTNLLITGIRWTSTSSRCPRGSRTTFCASSPDILPPGRDRA